LIYVVLAIAALLFIGLSFRLLNYISGRWNPVTPVQLADAIERHLEGRDAGPWDWGEFTAARIADEHLDKIRIRCIEIGDAASSQKSRQELREIISELRCLEEQTRAGEQG